MRKILIVAAIGLAASVSFAEEPSGPVVPAVIRVEQEYDASKTRANYEFAEQLKLLEAQRERKLEAARIAAVRSLEPLLATYQHDGNIALAILVAKAIYFYAPKHDGALRILKAAGIDVETLPTYETAKPTSQPVEQKTETPTAKTYRFVIPANVPWTETVTVKKGDVVRIQARGEWGVNNGMMFGPEGKVRGPRDKYGLHLQARLNEEVYRIGMGKMLTAESDGQILMGMHASSKDNKIGQMEVLISVSPAN